MTQQFDTLISTANRMRTNGNQHLAALDISLVESNSLRSVLIAKIVITQNLLNGCLMLDPNNPSPVLGWGTAGAEHTVQDCLHYKLPVVAPPSPECFYPDMVVILYPDGQERIKTSTLHYLFHTQWDEFTAAPTEAAWFDNQANIAFDIFDDIENETFPAPPGALNSPKPIKKYAWVFDVFTQNPWYHQYSIKSVAWTFGPTVCW